MAGSTSKSFRLFFLLFLLSGLQITQAQSPEYVPGQLLVKVKSGSLNKASFPVKGKLGIPSLDAINASNSVKKVELFLKQKYPTKKLAGIFRISFSKDQNLEEIIAAYEQDPNVEYAQPNYVHRLDFTPNDSLFENQNALKIIQAEQAWDLQLASPEIIVGVIDTGIDYNHEDLIDALRINSGED